MAIFIRNSLLLKLLSCVWSPFWPLLLPEVGVSWEPGLLSTYPELLGIVQKLMVLRNADIR
jgi:hypothetical protein